MASHLGREFDVIPRRKKALPYPGGIEHSTSRMGNLEPSQTRCSTLRQLEDGKELRRNRNRDHLGLLATHT